MRYSIIKGLAVLYFAAMLIFIIAIVLHACKVGDYSDLCLTCLAIMGSSFALFKLI